MKRRSLKSGHAHVETRSFEKGQRVENGFSDFLKAQEDSVLARFKNASHVSTTCLSKFVCSQMQEPLVCQSVF